MNETTQLKDLLLSSEMMDAQQIRDFIRQNASYHTTFEVFPTTKDIPSGTEDSFGSLKTVFGWDVSKDKSLENQVFTGLKYVDGAKACDSITLMMYSSQPKESSDVTIGWGDGSTTRLRTDVVQRYEKTKDEETKTEEYVIEVRHTYAMPYVNRKNIVSITGGDYYMLRNVETTANNIISRFFDNDLQVSRNLLNMSSCFKNAGSLLRILCVDTKAIFVQNFTGMFTNCKNLQHVYVSPYLFGGKVHSCNYMFQGCKNLSYTNVCLPAYIPNNYVRNQYEGFFDGCESLDMDVNDLLPLKGFGNRRIGIGLAFRNCKKLHGKIPAELLWEDTTKLFSTWDAFAGCNDGIRSQVPILWGGTNSKITVNPQTNTADDYITSFKVYASHRAILPGTADPDTGIEYKVETPVRMKTAINIYTTAAQEDCDIIIDWGDTTISVLRKCEIVDRDSIPHHEEDGQTFYDLTNVEGLIAYEKKVEYLPDYSIEIIHKYITPGKYMVRIFGTNYHMVRNSLSNYGPTVKDKYQFTNVCECFGYECSFADCVKNVSSFAAGSPFLQRVFIPVSHHDNFMNCHAMFYDCENLVHFDADDQNTFLKNNSTTAYDMFWKCINLERCDNLYVPSNMTFQLATYRSMFDSCAKLSSDALTLLPRNGFSNHVVNIDGFFSGAKKLTCSDYAALADILWNDTSKKFIKFNTALKNCGLDMAKIPVAWGGTDSSIQIDPNTGTAVKGNQYKPLSGYSWNGNDYVETMISCIASELGADVNFKQQGK